MRSYFGAAVAEAATFGASWLLLLLLLLLLLPRMKRTWSTRALKLYGSFIASSDSILRLIWMFSCFRPWISSEYLTCRQRPGGRCGAVRRALMWAMVVAMRAGQQATQRRGAAGVAAHPVLAAACSDARDPQGPHVPLLHSGMVDR